MKDISNIKSPVTLIQHEFIGDDDQPYTAFFAVTDAEWEKIRSDRAKHVYQ